MIARTLPSVMGITLQDVCPAVALKAGVGSTSHRYVFGRALGRWQAKVPPMADCALAVLRK